MNKLKNQAFVEVSQNSMDKWKKQPFKSKLT